MKLGKQSYLYVLAIVCFIGVISITLPMSTHGKPANKVVSERLITKLDLSSWNMGTATVSPDNKHVAFGGTKGHKQFVVVDGKEGKHYDGVGTPIIFSPDSRRVEYAAKIGKRWCVIVDKTEEKHYDQIGGPIVFSPDSTRVGYHASLTENNWDKWFMVVNRKEGNEYTFGAKGVGKIVFGLPDVIHYLILKDESIYFVEERIE